MLTVDIVAKKDKVKEDRYPIYLRIRTEDKKYIYRFTKHWIPVKDWDDKKLCKGKNASYKNTDLLSQKEAIELSIMQSQISKSTEVKKAIKPKTETNCFFEYAGNVLKEMAADKAADISDNTISRYESEIEVLRQYQTTISLQDVTPSFLINYKKHREKTSENNTVWASFKFIRKITKKAFGEKLITDYPFYTQFENNPTKFKMPKYEQNTPIYLTLAELDKLIGNLNEDYLTETDNTVLAFFLLECTCGLRHSDWGNFKTEKIMHRNSVKVRATKNGNYIYVAIDNSPRLKKVVGYIQSNNLTYDFTIKTANQSLKYIAGRAKVHKDITSHVGRHTCAVLHLEMGYSREYVAELLGISMKIVDTYAKITGRKMVAEYEKFGGL